MSLNIKEVCLHFSGLEVINVCKEGQGVQGNRYPPLFLAHPDEVKGNLCYTLTILDLVKVFGAGPVSCPIPTKLAWMVRLGILKI